MRDSLGRPNANGSGMDVRNSGSPYVVALLKDLAKKKDLQKGIGLHDEMRKHHLLRSNHCIATALVCMYAKCGDLPRAWNTFDEVGFRELVAWNALISVCIRLDRCRIALDLLAKMLDEGLPPDAITCVSILKACARTRDIRKGKEIHSTFVNRCALEGDAALGNALIDMYAKCGDLRMARRMLEELPRRDVVSWNALMTGYNQHEKSREALSCFDQMRNEGVSPDAVTFACVFKACGNLRDVGKGEEAREEAEGRGFLCKDIVLGNALVDMYVKCGRLPRASEVLKGLPIRDTVSWSTLISGYAQNGELGDAFKGFQCMLNEGLSPNVVTFVGILKACGSAGAISMGRKMHEEIIERGLMGKNLILHNALVDMYARCGALEQAQELLEELPARDLVTWCSLISGYAQQGRSNEALHCFERMQHEGLSPNTAAFLCILRACGSSGALHKGKQIHEQISKGGFLHQSIMLGTALVDMYAKCGWLTKAQEVLEGLSSRDVISWSTLIAGYAQQGQCHEAIDCFERMCSEGFAPDKVTFQCLLSACGRSGLLEKARFWFRNMSRDYDMIPDSRHRACMVLMLGSMGLFEEATCVAKAMPDSNELWLALLGSCKKWGNAKQAQEIVCESRRTNTCDDSGRSFMPMLLPPLRC